MHHPVANSNNKMKWSLEIKAFIFISQEPFVIWEEAFLSLIEESKNARVDAKALMTRWQGMGTAEGTFWIFFFEA